MAAVTVRTDFGAQENKVCFNCLVEIYDGTWQVLKWLSYYNVSNITVTYCVLNFSEIIFK